MFVTGLYLPAFAMFVAGLYLPTFAMFVAGLYLPAFAMIVAGLYHDSYTTSRYVPPGLGVPGALQPHSSGPRVAARRA